MDERRNRALDQWNYRGLFAPFHISWGEAAQTPAFEAMQAYGIALQELGLDRSLEVWAHRAVLHSFSSEHIQVGGRAAANEPGWVVMVAGVRRQEGAGNGGVLASIAPGGGAVVQALIHARSGELLLGRAVPVALRRG